MTLEHPRFRKVNEGFLCLNCGTDVPPASSSCRDHCPECLWSLHVDINPGDRASGCGGMLRPVGVQRHAKKGWMITYCCNRCGAERVNRFVERDRVWPDRLETLLALSREAGTT